MPCHPDPAPCSAGEGSQGIFFVKVFFSACLVIPILPLALPVKDLKAFSSLKSFFSDECLVILILPLALPVKDLKAFFYYIRIVIRRLLLPLR